MVPDPYELLPFLPKTLNTIKFRRPERESFYLEDAENERIQLWENFSAIVIGEPSLARNEANDDLDDEEIDGNQFLAEWVLHGRTKAVQFFLLFISDALGTHCHLRLCLQRTWNSSHHLHSHF